MKCGRRIPGFGGLEGLPTERVLERRAGGVRLHAHASRSHRLARDLRLVAGLGRAVQLESEVNKPRESRGARLARDIARVRTRLHCPSVDAQSVRVDPEIDRIRATLLFLHSPEDAVIPIAEGRRLYDAARSGDVRQVRGGHVDATNVDTKAL